MRHVKILWPIMAHHGPSLWVQHVEIFWGLARQLWQQLWYAMLAFHSQNIRKNPSETRAAVRFLRGPQANARQADLDDLAAAGRGDTVPSVVGFKAVKKDRRIRRVGVV